MSRRSLPSIAARRILKKCQFCTLPFGVRDMKKHLHECTFNPTRRSSRGVRIIRPCRYCGEAIAPGSRRSHTKQCALNPYKQLSPCNYCGESIANGTRRTHKVSCASNPRNMAKKTEGTRGN